VAVKTRTRGRAHRNVEFLKTLQNLTGHTAAAFARLCGKRPTNMTNYLNGKLVPGDKVLWSSLEHLFEWDVDPFLEIRPIPEPLSKLPTDPGLYILYDSAGNVLYIGKATNLRAEVRQTLRRQIPEPVRFGPKMKKTKPRLSSLATHISCYGVPSERVRHNLEVLLLRVTPNQTHNSNIGKFR
jgi:hypothetical protein